MKITRLAAVALGTVGLASAALPAQTAGGPRDAILVSAQWLAAHLHDANLVLLHLGDSSEYAKAHIPGARFVALSDLSVSGAAAGGLSLEMPSADQLRQSLERLGISTGSRVIVYSASDRITAATRVLFTLDYAGLGGSSALLDGGLAEWRREGHEVTDARPPMRVGSLPALSVRPIVVSAADVRARIGRPAVSVVDARLAAFYDGTQTGGTRDAPHRTGHIAGAKSLPFSQVTDDLLRLKPAADLAALFAGAGVQPGDTVIGYCHIGQQATALLFAARSLGHAVLLYDGSFEDWSRQTSLPVDNPASKARP